MSRNFELLAGKARIAPAVPERAFAPQPTLAPRLPGGPAAEPQPWLQAVAVLRRQWRISLAFAALVIGAVAVTTWFLPRTYAPEARLEIQPPGVETFSLNGSPGLQNTAEYLQTQTKDLESDELLLQVLRDLHLVAGLTPERLAASQADNVVRLTPPESRALSNFHKNLKVRRDTGSWRVLVSFASEDPVLAARITNTLVDDFIQRDLRLRHQVILESSEWLSRQLDDIRQKMDESNRKLAEFQQATGIAEVDDGRNTYTDQKVEQNRELTQAQAERIQLESFLNRIRNGHPETLPQVQSNPVIQQLQEKLSDVRAELAQARVLYGPNHTKIKTLQKQETALNAQLQANMAAIVGQLRTSYAAAAAREQRMTEELRGTAKELSDVARYSALKKEALANATLYNNLYQKVKETGLAAASKSSGIRVVDRARVLNAPTSPNWGFNLGVAVLAALVGGVLIAFVRERFSTKLQSLEEFRTWTGMSSISVMPAIVGSGDPNRAWARALLPSRTDGVPQKFLLERPTSPEAEALRSLHASLMLSQTGRPPQMILLTSCFQREGKTTVAINLGLALSRHAKTCLVDADFRGSGVEQSFGLQGQLGLADVLRAGAALDSVIVNPVPEESNFSVLPAGTRTDRPAELAFSEEMREALTRLRERFEFVVVDAPPVLPYSDSRTLGPLVDGIVLVARSGYVTREALSRSLELFRQVHSAPVMEVVLNGADAYHDYGNYGYRGGTYKAG